jgi:hypothetical protein
MKDESINTEEKPKMSQKAENLFTALRKYVDENNGDAFFNIEFGSLDESGGVSENWRVAYGDIDETFSPDKDDSVVEEGSSNSEEKPELSQEAKNIFEALYKYVEKHNGDAFFHVDFGALDDPEDIVDASWDMYGPDELTKISLEGMLKHIKQKETED